MSGKQRHDAKVILVECLGARLGRQRSWGGGGRRQALDWILVDGDLLVCMHAVRELEGGGGAEYVGKWASDLCDRICNHSNKVSNQYDRGCYKDQA